MAPAPLLLAAGPQGARTARCGTDGRTHRRYTRQRHPVVTPAAPHTPPVCTTGTRWGVMRPTSCEDSKCAHSLTHFQPAPGTRRHRRTACVQMDGHTVPTPRPGSLWVFLFSNPVQVFLARCFCTHAYLYAQLQGCLHPCVSPYTTPCGCLCVVPFQGWKGHCPSPAVHTRYPYVTVPVTVPIEVWCFLTVPSASVPLWPFLQVFPSVLPASSL